jgi:hypothetical protein
VVDRLILDRRYWLQLQEEFVAEQRRVPRWRKLMEQLEA